MLNKGLFLSSTSHYSTPVELYRALDFEFHFTDDPCPLYGNSGLEGAWGERTYVNPPYGREIGKWLKKAVEESRLGKTVVCLIPSRTDTAWWHDYVMQADEIRFIRGRLRFSNARWNAPFPSAIVIFNKERG